MEFDTVNKKTKSLYYILGLILFLCVIAYILGPRLGWFLTSSYTTLRISKASDTYYIDADDPDYPLEFISDGYKFTNIVEKQINWVWEYTVLNKSDKTLKITVTYKLIDKDDFIIISSTGEGYASKNSDKNSEITIKGEGSIPIYDLNRVYDNTWSISYSEI